MALDRIQSLRAAYLHRNTAAGCFLLFGENTTTQIVYTKQNDEMATSDIDLKYKIHHAAHNWNINEIKQKSRTAKIQKKNMK